MKKTAIILAFLTLCVFTLSSCGGSIEFSSGDGVMSYTLKNYSGEDKREFECEKGTEIKIEIERTSGRLDISIETESGEREYVSNDAYTGSFIITMSESGVYKIKLLAKSVDGTVTLTRVN